MAIPVSREKDINSQRHRNSQPNALHWWQTVLGLALFALIGSSLILAEKIVPQRFPPQTDAQILAELQTMPAVRENADLAETLSQPAS